MMNNHDKHDPLLREMFRKQGADRPSDDFTAKIMGRIETTPQSDTGSIFSPITWVLIGLGLAFSIFTLFFFEVPFIKQLLPGSGFNPTAMIQWLTQDFVLAMKDLFSFLKFSNISIIIILSIVSLVVLDRVLRIRKRAAMLLA